MIDRETGNEGERKKKREKWRRGERVGGAEILEIESFLYGVY